MEWTDIRLTVAKSDADNAEAVATMIAEGGIYIEDYSDIEQQVAEIAHVDLIEQELLDKPRDRVIIHMYLEPGASPVETLALISARMEAAGIAYTVETEGVRAGGLAERLAQVLPPVGDRQAAGRGALLAGVRHRPRQAGAGPRPCLRHRRPRDHQPVHGSAGRAGPGR